ncbi:MAG: RNA binding S1 domain protein [Parcubacteria group bacterium GW2011_GWD2_38_12]|uniref:30S ribosomal protein S1 n=1 Tax=Candidatus Azambacteria bacterium RIFCSPLOWO2_01_FULL_37_9 TaxID=1797297 RepID=A0A1F5C6G3_9BACT|nr:MAG: RNA binding S1 domain protein [Parcubacteria group bacterium GW2011_GWC2_36_17]KKQ39121.1 MAG: RNA binding S1 domain protein [Candidatus Moranbacteria bacterium GW2011_GWF2_37_7]KKQ41514.1 MAG: RNA binding S1 domain protein [Parcubacteria group bacterium GW2011_GWE2_37_8]KKQ51467.1 MAG: RNA binding S1 domain protein [Parcubacteria group bacterium GW2011_GWD2_38_12]KKQ58708.1 MAG: RNA binding S1 domain protein [Parcubacteria group bacterium GW2011_GWC1_38_17]OGD38467.1 MAG: 30S ribosoma
MDNSLSPKFLMEEALKNILPAQLPKVGELIDGAILGKKGSCLYINLGAFGIGVIYGKEYYEAQDLIKGVKIGDKVSAKVLELQNDDGYVELSLKEAGQEMAWDELRKIKESGEIISVKITEANRGGIMAQVKGVPAFMPVSQLSVKNYPRIEGGDKTKILQELNKFIGKNMNVKVIDIDQKESKLIISERGVQDEDLKGVLDNFKVGDIIEGEISGVVDFGAFVKIEVPGEKNEDIPQIEGLVHISELDWQLIEDPKQVVKIGDKIQAKIIGIDGDKISLSMKALKNDPWINIEDTYKVGQIIKGKTVKINPFGAFIKLDNNIQGLCHISEFKSEEEMKEKLEVGKSYTFNIQLINKAEHRLALGFGKTAKEKEKSEKEKDKINKNEEKKEEAK